MGSAGKRQSSAQSEFGRWVVSDLQRAGCTDKQLAAIVLATVSTTIAFLRSNRRQALATNPSARQLTKQQFAFENALLRSTALALPKPQKRGRKKDIDTVKKLARIIELDPRRTKWVAIEKVLNAEFGAGGNAEAYKKIYKRDLPLALQVFCEKFLPFLSDKQIGLLISSAMKSAKGRPGRPKTRHN